jgi:hypothetical protein
VASYGSCLVRTLAQAETTGLTLSYAPDLRVFLKTHKRHQRNTSGGARR